MVPSKETAPWNMTVEEAEQKFSGKVYHDCPSCRITGSAAFIGLGAYTYIAGMRNLRKQEKLILKSPTKFKMGPRRLGVATMSASLLGLGLWRAFN